MIPQHMGWQHPSKASYVFIPSYWGDMDGKGILRIYLAWLWIEEITESELSQNTIRLQANTQQHSRFPRVARSED